MIRSSFFIISASEPPAAAGSSAAAAPRMNPGSTTSPDPSMATPPHTAATSSPGAIRLIWLMRLIRRGLPSPAAGLDPSSIDPSPCDARMSIPMPGLLSLLPRGSWEAYAHGNMPASPLNGLISDRFRDPALVDFGADGRGRGRRLERLGGVLVDRPLPHALGPRCRAEIWGEAGAVFTGATSGSQDGWSTRGSLPEPWEIVVPLDGVALVLEVRPAPSGQVGVFLEQVPQWDWLVRATRPGQRMLSLFAHSGAATLAVAAAGAEVVHVDASPQACRLARRNAAASGLARAAIRWICEDARTFVARELKRGSVYDGAVLDPPSWGHGPRGRAFAIDRDLVPLMHDIGRLVSPAGAAGPVGPVLLTCHSPRWHHERLHDTLATCLPPGAAAARRIESGRLVCHDDAGRPLPLGDVARVAREVRPSTATTTNPPHAGRTALPDAP
jgi:23S rRNA (cytosine1962-C5)-methyltransferase